VLLLVLAAIAAFGFWRKILRVVGLLGHNKNKHPFELADWQCAQKSKRTRARRTNKQKGGEAERDPAEADGGGRQGGGMRDWLRRHTAGTWQASARRCVITFFDCALLGTFLLSQGFFQEWCALSARAPARTSGRTHERAARRFEVTGVIGRRGVGWTMVWQLCFYALPGTPRYLRVG
jgi:hypothetical protein